MLQKKNYQIIALSGFVAVVGISAVAACSSTTETTDPGTSSSGGTKDAGKTSSSTSSSSGSTTSSSTSSTSSSGSTTSSSTSSTSSSGDGGSTSSSGVDPVACGKKAKEADCSTCCDPTDSFNKVFGGAFLTCECAAGGKCATDCAATVCANKQPAAGDACDTCLTAEEKDQNAVCIQKGLTACAADKDCTAQDQCYTAAKCADLP